MLSARQDFANSSSTAAGMSIKISTKNTAKNVIGDAQKLVEISEKLKEASLFKKCSYLHKKEVNCQGQVNEPINLLREAFKKKTLNP